jgi:hypothetical protein
VQPQSATALIVLCFAALAMLASSACVSKPKGGLTELPEVPVVAPFDALALPTSGGRVWACTGPVRPGAPAVMHVAYDGVDRMTLAGRYSTALMKRTEWTRRGTPRLAPASFSVVYEDQDAEQTLTVLIADSTFDGKVPHGVDVALTITVARPR